MNNHLKQAFAIVELLIVIVIIGILAATSIVTYNGVSNKAADSVVQAEIGQAYKQGRLAGVEDSVPDPWQLLYNEGSESSKQAALDYLNANFKVSLSNYKSISE